MLAKEGRKRSWSGGVLVLYHLLTSQMIAVCGLSAEAASCIGGLILLVEQQDLALQYFVLFRCVCDCFYSVGCVFFVFILTCHKNLDYSSEYY